MSVITKLMGLNNGRGRRNRIGFTNHGNAFGRRGNPALLNDEEFARPGPGDPEMGALGQLARCDPRNDYESGGKAVPELALCNSDFMHLLENEEELGLLMNETHGLLENLQGWPAYLLNTFASWRAKEKDN
jgi:hypothetical protein